MVKKWFTGIFRKKAAVSDRERLQAELQRQADLAVEVAELLCAIVNGGHGCCLKLLLSAQGEGWAPQLGVILDGKAALTVFMANWACAEHLVKKSRLDAFLEGGPSAFHQRSYWEGCGLYYPYEEHGPE
jgi:hypothetical protein